MADDKYLTIKHLTSEGLYRDIIIFSLSFVFVVAQDWNNIFLLLFPAVSFGFAMFFRVLDAFKVTTLSNNYIIYNPLGMEKIHANRLNFCALLLLILLFWIGAESYYHPQLIKYYDLFFSLIFVFVYTFGYYWIFIDLWKYCRIEVKPYKQISEEGQLSTQNTSNLLAFLKIKKFKIITMINLLLFVVLNALNIIFSLMIENNQIEGMLYSLPGSNLNDSVSLSLSVMIFPILILSPLVTIIIFYLNYKEINNINTQRLTEIIEPFPESVQNQIKKDLAAINKKFRKKYRLE
ncbi:MAG: hypothetical protein GF383_08320 [Candidatus Lokiarchaeota archaeon]|nr:hypothetical protein [Candidatus Lokiarchaeota archaeon]MBD3340356.1 hypothetical protein [Candidatus Lokiarchaeota archaeon]